MNCKYFLVVTFMYFNKLVPAVVVFLTWGVGTGNNSHSILVCFTDFGMIGKMPRFQFEVAIILVMYCLFPNSSFA